MKTQNPLIGRMKGSAGGMTGSKVYDKNVLRAKAFEVNNPNTQAQQTQRLFFKEVSAVAASLTPEQLRCIFPNQPKGISRRNAFFKQLAENYQVEGTVKSMKLDELVTVGNARTMDFGSTSCSFDGSAATVGLSASVKNNADVADYYFIAMLVNETKETVLLTADSAKVSVGTLSINTPSSWDSTDTVHAIPLITDSKSAVTGFGSLGVNERPSRN